MKGEGKRKGERRGGERKRGVQNWFMAVKARLSRSW